MKLHKYDFLLLIPVFGAMVVSTILVQSFYRAKSVHKDLIAPPPNLERFVFGYGDPAADFLWLRAIQDLDYCENKSTTGECIGNGWLYQMLDTVTRLSPKYRIVYAAGATVLSVLVQDKEGARLLFERGVSEYPQDWPILYRAAYHYLYEIKNDNRAAELLIQVAKTGGPLWTYSLATKLFMKEGKVAVAQAVLQDLIDSHADEKLIERVKKRVAEELTK